MFPNDKRITGTCIDCSNNLELFEIDMEKDTKIMKCTSCGLFHFYKKGLLGGWRILKVSKDPSRVQDIK